MTRTYARNELTWDLDDVLALVEAGQAKAFPSPAGTNYVVKIDGSSFAIRAHQIVNLPALDLPDPEDLSYLREVIAEPVTPMTGYQGKEIYDGEDGGPGGVVYDSALELATSYLRVIKDRRTDPLLIVRNILDDEEGEYAHSLRETVEDDAIARKGAVLAPNSIDEDALLAKFGV